MEHEIKFPTSEAAYSLTNKFKDIDSNKNKERFEKIYEEELFYLKITIDNNNIFMIR